MADTNPCIACGACCACFRVSFYWGETTEAPEGIVPVALTAPISSPHRVAMLGTDQPNPRCIALQGELGKQVACSIYEHRPSPCREFQASGEYGELNRDCDKARSNYGLMPLVI